MIPAFYAQALKEVQKTDSHIPATARETAGSSPTRIEMIDAIVTQAKRTHPHLFVSDDEETIRRLRAKGRNKI
jgi:hypothetical protein